ncbi:MaoC family dehydratase [Minwuia sp.]|uniref:MaoC family dehydratase n=1 Tax=Minwuia sp. TaxID=2493630 RepID=UPI003A918701
MLTVETPNDLKNHVGADLGVSRWVEVDQDMIQAFADATGDHQWIHVDVERAKNEMPGGKCIAHGFLTLSLIPQLMYEMVKVEKLKNGINYGSNKLRFTNMVPAGSKVRLGMKIKEVNDMGGGGTQLVTETRMEIDGQERPALVAETITAYFA